LSSWILVEEEKTVSPAMTTLKLPDLYQTFPPPAPFKVQEMVVVLLATFWLISFQEN
jgi:hypothetical protein